MSYVVLTGATSGIGLALARRLSDVDLLVLHGPEADPPSAVNARPGARYLSADFRELGEVERLASRILDLGPPDVLINNAAIPGPRRYARTTDGIEVTFQVNYLAGALLTDLLLAAMPAGARIVNTASATHYSAVLDLDDLDFDRHPYSAVAAYSRSKLAIVTASSSLAARIPQTVVSVHPGVISTQLLHAMFGSGGDSVEHGAANLEAAMSADVPSGTYLDESSPAAPNPIADDPGFQERLHSLTSRLVGRQIR